MQTQPDISNKISGAVKGSALDHVGPIESKMRSTLSRLKNSQYPDDFDWSLYDRIAEKFEEPPRGGVVFNTTFKLANWHPTCSKCHYAFEVDTYGRGCFHNCAYCYAKDELSSHGYWNRPQPFPVNLAEIRKVFYTVFETDKPHKLRSIMEQKIPLRIGSMSDSFMWLDTKYHVTLEFMKILNFYKYPNVVFTRSDLIAKEPYLSTIDPELTAVQFSIAGNNEKVTRKIEPGAPSYRRRLDALTTLSNAGINSAVRINPLFPKYPDGYFTDPDYFKSRWGRRSDAPVLDMYDDNFVSELADTGIKTLLVGIVRLSAKTVKYMSQASGVDVRSFYRPELWNPKGHDNRFSSKEVAYYYKMYQRQAANNGVRFSTCYIGNGIEDYFGYQNIWSDKKDCCDIRSQIKSFKTSCQSIPWDVRSRFSSNKAIAESSKEQDLKSRPTNLLLGSDPLTKDFQV